MGLQAKLIAAGVVLALLGGLLWREKWLVDHLKQSHAETAAARAALATEKANRKTEHEDREKADASVVSLQGELDRIQHTAAEPVSVYCRPAKLPSAASQGGSAAGPAGPAIGPGAEEPFQDIGRALSDVWIEHESNDARHRALIDWERVRSH